MEILILSYLAIMIFVVAPLYYVWLCLNDNKKPKPAAFLYNIALITMPLFILSNPTVINTENYRTRIFDLEYENHKLEVQIDSLKSDIYKQDRYILELQLEYVNSLK